MIKVQVEISETFPKNVLGIGVPEQPVLGFTVVVDSLDEVEYRVADTIRAGLAVHPTKANVAKLRKEIKELTEAQQDEPVIPWKGPVPPGLDVPEDHPMRGGKHSGDCSCSGCVAPSPEELEHHQVVIDNP